ncbi:hypothetical protein [Ferrimicrobium acidiphilum]|jgi:hypothetical protein|uniref:hypothetical protein n=1 Tax=Ferrimicrobium acidiphilum TaxID=121039 RepID=UPI0023F1C167|nr:hypothetical protein [Ferrimicrobium acidiphilum]
MNAPNEDDLFPSEVVGDLIAILKEAFTPPLTREEITRDVLGSTPNEIVDKLVMMQGTVLSLIHYIDLLEQGEASDE